MPQEDWSFMPGAPLGRAQRKYGGFGDPQAGIQRWLDMQASRPGRVAGMRQHLIGAPGIPSDAEQGVPYGVHVGGPNDGPTTPTGGYWRTTGGAIAQNMSNRAGGAQERMLDAVLAGQDIRFGGLNGQMPYSALRDNVARPPGGGGYRVHPMTPTFPGSYTPPPAYTGPQGVPGGDQEAAAAFLRQRQMEIGSGQNGRPTTLNYDANGVPNGFNGNGMAGRGVPRTAVAVPRELLGATGAALPPGQAPVRPMYNESAPGGGGAGYSAATQLARLNRGVKDPKMMYRLGQDGAIVDPFGNAMSGEDAHRQILGMNTAARGQQEDRMRDSRAYRSNMAREREAAMRWNAAKARQISPDMPLSPVAQFHAMDEGMPGGMGDRRLDIEGQRQQMQQGLGERALDMEELKLKNAVADKAVERQGTLTPRQQAAVDIWSKGIDPSKMTPGEANKAMNNMKKWLLGEEGTAEGGGGAGGTPAGMPDIPAPKPGKGAIDQLGLSPENITLAESATSRDDLWNKLVRAGVWKPNDKDSLRQFKEAATQLQLDEPVGEAAMQFNPPILWPFTGGGPLVGEYNRYKRGEAPRPPLWRLLMGE
jgi:hypothetical protein